MRRPVRPCERDRQTLVANDRASEEAVAVTNTMTPLRIFISSVQTEFAQEREALRDYLR